MAATVVPVRLPPPVLSRLAAEAKISGLSRSEIIRHALTEHFRQRAIGDLQRIGAGFRPLLAAQGMHSEEDVAARLDA
jgi:hypothetical protein